MKRRTIILLVFMIFISVLVVLQEPNEYPQIDSETYTVGTSERALAEYLNCWKDEDWNEMLKFTQKSWTYTLDQYGNPSKTLKALYERKQLLGAKITKKTSVSAFEDQIRATIYYYEDETIVQKEFIINVIQESEPFKQNLRGDWGINPTTSKEE